MPFGRGLVPFFAANVCVGSGLFFHAFLYNFYLDGLALGENVMGAAAGALTAGGLAALLPAGLVIDRVGPRVAFFAAVALAGAGLALGALAERPLAVYAAAFVAGAGTAGWRVAMAPILLQLAGPPTRARAFSWNVALLVGSGAAWMALAGWTAGWLETDAGLARVSALRGALLLGAAGTMLAAAAFAFVGLRGRVAARDGALAPRAWALVRVPRALAGVVVLVALWMLGPALVLPFFNLYFLREHGLAIDRIGVIFALTHALTALVILASGEMAGRLGPRRVLAVWVLLFGPALWLLTAVDALGLAVAVYFVQGIVSPATNPLIDQILLESAPADQRGVVSGWRNAATELAGIAGAGAGGAVLEATSFVVLFWGAGSIGLLAAVALTAAVRAFRSP